MDLDAIEARANAATEGPWKHYPRPNSGLLAYQNEPSPIVYRDHPTPGVGLVILTADRGTEADVAFAAHARTDVPDLVARVRALEEENQQLRGDLDAATVFHIGDVQVHKTAGSQNTGTPDKWHVAISPTSPRWVPSVPHDEDDRDGALARARDIAKEKM